MSGLPTSAARTIATVIPQCPACGCEDYCAVFRNGAGTFALEALRCEKCEEDILGLFLTLPPSVRALPANSRNASPARAWIGPSCIAAAALLGWLILAESGWL